MYIAPMVDHGMHEPNNRTVLFERIHNSA